MSEDEALAHAIAASLNAESPTSTSSSFIGNKDTPSAQELEDRMIAEALMASEREARAATTTRNAHEQKCTLS